MSSETNRHAQGLWLAAIAAILFSAKAIVAKFIYRHGVDALTLMMLRMAMSLPVFAAVAILETRRARARDDRLSARELARIVLLGVLGYYLASLLDFAGLQYVSASLERLILFLTPTLVLVIGVLVWRKPSTARQWLALATSYAGIVLVFWDNLRVGGEHVMLGSALIFGAALSYAMYLSLSGEMVARVGSLRLVAYAMCVSTAMTLAHFLLTHPLTLLAQPMPVLGLSLVNAVMCTVLPVYMTMFAVARVGAATVAQFSLLGPVSLVFLGWWLLDEPITALQLIGTAIVVLGVWGVTRAGTPQNKSPAR